MELTKGLLERNRSIVRYLIAGGLTFGVDYGSLVACYYLFDLSLWLATSVGYIAGLCVSFSLNRRWVYGDKGRERKAGYQLVEYTILLVFNYFFTVFAVHILNTFNIPPSVSKICVTVLIVCWNYVIYSRVIFRTKGTTS